MDARHNFWLGVLSTLALLLIVFLIYQDLNREIEPISYYGLSRSAQAAPELKPLISAAMQDGKITQLEYISIAQKYANAVVESARDNKDLYSVARANLANTLKE